MRRVLLLMLVAIAWWSGAVNAQGDNDSLHRDWTNTALPDTQRLASLYNLILEEYMYTNPDTAFVLSTTYRQFAQKKGLNKGVVDGILLQGYSIYMKGDAEKALVYFQEALVLSVKYKAKSQESTAADMVGQMLGDLGKHEEALTYLERSLKLNLQMNYRAGISSSYNNIAIAYSRQSKNELALSYLKKSLDMEVAAGDSIAVSNNLNNIGNVLKNMGRITEAKALYLRAIRADSSPENARHVSHAFNNLSLISAEEGNFQDAINYATQSRDLAKKYGDVPGEASGWSMMGAVHSRQGLYVQAIEELSQGLKLYESVQDPDGTASALANIANTQLDQKAYTEALATYEKAKAVFERLGRKEALAQINSSIGNVYRDLKKHEKALTYYETSLAIAREIRTPALTAYALARIADVYFRQLNLEKARTYILDALKLSDTPDDQLSHAENLSLAGRIYHQSGDQALAIVYGKKAYESALRIGTLPSLSSASEVLYLAYKATGQTAKALTMHENYITYRDSMVNEENTRAIFQQQMQYEFEKKEAATRADQEKKDALAQSELGRRNLQRNASLGGLGLVAILAGVLFVNGRRRRRTNELLTAQKTEIQAKSNQNELLLKEIHHRVKNNLQTISSLLHLQSAHIKDADVRQAVAAGQHRVESMALIHQKLYQRDNLAAIEMKDYLSNLVQSLIDTFDADPERIRFNLDMPDLEMDVDTAVPLGLIVNELITNSLKYAFPNGREGTITVSLQKADNQLLLLVADDGVGKANTATGTSFGSQLVGLLTAQVGGKITQDASNGYITRIVLPQNLV